MNLSSITEDFLRKNTPQKEWFASESMIGSDYHGIDHLLRVFVLAEKITDLLIESGKVKPKQINRVALLFAAKIHDIRRTSDLFDNDHAQKAAEFSKKIVLKNMPPKMKELIFKIVQLHDKNNLEMKDFPIELFILKDADALERIRLVSKLPKFTPMAIRKKLELDPKRLHFQQSHRLIEFANNLFYESVKDKKRRVADPAGAIWNAVQTLSNAR